MIYSIGDCHAGTTFANISGITFVPIGGIIGNSTLRRVGSPEDTRVGDAINQLNLTQTDFLIFVFGEIDVRCYIKPVVDRWTSGLDDYLQTLSSKYCNKISTFKTNGAKICIMSIVPPSSVNKIGEGGVEPLSGTDVERSLYTVKLNTLLKDECELRGWVYLDVYSQYADNLGMLPLECSDDTVHIKDTHKVHTLLKSNNII